MDSDTKKHEIGTCVVCGYKTKIHTGKCSMCNFTLRALRYVKRDWEKLYGFKESMKKAYTIARNVTYMRRHKRAVVFIKEDTWEEQSRRYQIPWGKEGFFRNHDYGKIEIQVTEEGEDYVEGFYVC